jgi:hypothetical protein
MQQVGRLEMALSECRLCLSGAEQSFEDDVDSRFKKHLRCRFVSADWAEFPGLTRCAESTESTGSPSKYRKQASKCGSARWRFFHKIPPLHSQNGQIFLSFLQKYSGIGLAEGSGHLIGVVEPASGISRSITLLKSSAGRCLARLVSK